MAEEVKVIVGADTRQLTSELDKANKAIKNFGSTVQSGANKASLALTDLSRIAQDAPYGFIGISNNINPLVESFGRLKAETGSTGGALKALAGALTGPAGLGLAFGLFSAAISFASVGLSRWVKTSGEAKQKTKDFNDELNKSKESAMATGIQLQSFVDVAKNATLPLSQRNEALRQANDLMGKHGELLTLNNVGTQQITTQTKLYTEALIQQAVAQKYTNKIAELTISKNEKLVQLQQAQTVLAKEKAKPIPIGQGAIGAAKFIEIFTQRVIDAQKEVTGVDNEIVKLGLELQKSTNIATSFFGQIGEKAKDSKDKSKSLGESIDQIISKFRRKLTAEEALGLPPMEEIKAKINDYEAVIKKLITDKKVPLTDKRLINLQLELQDLSLSKAFINLKESFRNEKIDAPLEGIDLYIPETKIFELVEAERKALIDSIKKLKLSKLEIKAEFGIGGFENMNVEPLRKWWGTYFKAAQEESKKFNQKIQQLFINATTDSFKVIGESIAMAISGQGDGIKNAFDGLFTIFADAIIQLGQYAILQSALIKQLKLAISSGSFTGGVAAGIALIALGTVIKSTLSGISKKSGFATGTSFAPGGMALVGERGPELVNLPRGSKVIPNGKTNAIMQGAMQAVEVYGTLRGQDIYFSNKKYGLTYNRQT